jgi:hypothetical protein
LPLKYTAKELWKNYQLATGIGAKHCFDGVDNNLVR